MVAAIVPKGLATEQSRADWPVWSDQAQWGSDTLEWSGGGRMTVWIAVVAFVCVVAILAALNASHTRGRSCCAPADPTADLRMRGVLSDDSSSADPASRG
jgi:hypothetical protein